MKTDPRSQSRALLDGADRAAARAYFKAVGFTDADLAKPLVGVAHCWIEITPCNWNHRTLAMKVKEGIRAAGGTPIEFNTITVTDGIAMGTEGMKASLISREVIADSVELVARGHLLDGFVGISGCDKTIPAMVMAMARLNLPSLMLYGGSIQSGEHRGQHITIQDVFEAIGAHNAGRIDRASCTRSRTRLPGRRRLRRPVHRQHHGHRVRDARRLAHGLQRRARRGSAEGGRRLPDRPAGDGPPEATDCGRGRSSPASRCYNSIAGVMATGGSTNAVLHLLAVAREAASSSPSTSSTAIVAQDAAAGRPQAVGQLHGARDVRRGRHGRRGEAPARGGLLHEEELTVTRPHDRRGGARARRRRRARR